MKIKYANSMFEDGEGTLGLGCSNKKRNETFEITIRHPGTAMASTRFELNREEAMRVVKTFSHWLK